MIKNILVDSDVILDLTARREPYYNNAAEIFTLAYRKKLTIYTTAVVLANVFYILRKIIGTNDSKNQIKNLRLLIKILPINENIVDMTLNSKFNDFEDGLHYFTAIDAGIKTIITRNVKDYREKDIAVLTPEEYLKISNSIK